MRIAYLPSRRYLLGLLVAGIFFYGLGATRADIVQPNGAVIPQTLNLQNYLNGSSNNDNINEGIDGVKDAAVEPQVFSPLCDFSGKYVAKGGSAIFAIGWYEGTPARPSCIPFRTAQTSRSNECSSPER